MGSTQMGSNPSYNPPCHGWWYLNCIPLHCGLLGVVWGATVWIGDYGFPGLYTFLSPTFHMLDMMLSVYPDHIVFEVEMFMVVLSCVVTSAFLGFNTGHLLYCALCMLCKTTLAWFTIMVSAIFG